MSFIIFLILIFIGIFINNKFKFFDLIVIAFFAILVYLITDVADYENYQNVYNWIAAGNFYKDTGLGWYYICKVGGLFGLTFRQMKCLILIISCLLIKSTIDLFVKDKKVVSFIWVLLMIYPMLIECVQIRFFLAEAIFIFGIRFLVENKLLGYIKYSLCIIIAYLIHASAIFYLIFLLVIIFDKIKKLLPVFVITSCFLFFILKKYLISFAGNFVNGLRIDRYFSEIDSVGIMGLITYIFVSFIFIIILSELYKKIKESDADYFQKNIVKIIFECSYLVALVVPLTFFDTNFFRIQRPFWLLLYISFAIYRENGNRKITIKKLCFNNRTLEILLVLFANIVFICIYTFDIIKKFLFTY